MFHTTFFYADDTNLVLSASISKDLISKGNAELKNIFEWVASNRLSLNDTKTQAMIFRTVNTKIPMDLPKLFLGSHEIKFVDSTEFLGVTITKHLSWKNHMISIKKKLRRNVGACRKVKAQLGISAMLSLYRSLMESHIHNSIVSWCHGNITLKNSIQRSCDNFLKLIFPNESPMAIRQTMIDHQLLSVDQLLFQEVGMTMLKVHNSSFPKCFEDFFPKTSHTMLTRSNQSFNLEKPRIQLTKQSLNYKGLLVWNEIPNIVKYVKNSNPPQLNSKNSFKKHLKDFITYFMNDILYTNRDV